MNNQTLIVNQKKRINLPLWMLICFAMFSFWQMGFIYFVGPSLTINGKTPLPINMDNVTVLIVICYILSILWMIFFPRTVIWVQRIATCAALLTAIGLFLPLGDDVLRLIIYAQVFFCCLMIGFETFLMVNYFSEKSNITHLTIAYGIACLMIAFLQNEFLPIKFPTFRFIMVVAIALLLLFFIKIPINNKVQPHYVTKNSKMNAPKHFFFAACILTFVSALIGVSGPAISGEIKNGIFITYTADAIACFIMYLLYRKVKFHPFRLIPFLVGIGGIGFLLMLGAKYVNFFSYIGCLLIGIGMVPCQILPLYGAVMMKSYPSKYISPVIISIALGAVLIQSIMVEIFRNTPIMLCLVYAIIMAVLVFIYTQTEPFFLFTLRHRPTNDTITQDDEEEKVNTNKDCPIVTLTKREKEVAEFICLGYSNREIAKILFLSEHTVKDYCKKIYLKLNVHSRIELAALINKYKYK